MVNRRRFWSFFLFLFYLKVHLFVLSASEVIDLDEPSDFETKSLDDVEDSIFDPLQADPDCDIENEDCWSPPASTLDQSEATMTIDASWSYGGDDPDANKNEDASCPSGNVKVDKHWGRDPSILKMRDFLRESGSGQSMRYQNKSSTEVNERPPIFLIPGLASTRLVSWKYKSCPHPFLSDIKVGDTVWLNMNLLVQMVPIDVQCFVDCLQLGWNQTDSDDASIGCKLRPDEGLDSISSLSPGDGIPTKLLVGGTNTVYAWLVQWLAENLGYDVGHLIGLPYDWRLSPDKMESRDGFLTHTRKRIEAAVHHANRPGILVAHSMGNVIFRYFLSWLQKQLQQETHQKLLKQYAMRTEREKARPSSGGSGYVGWAAKKVDEFLDENDAQRKGKEEIAKGKLWELAQIEGTAKYHAWLERHIWTYVGLSAPMLGAANPLRAVISGENMGVPWEDADARAMEITFGSTHTINPISSKTGFCDNVEFREWDEEDTARLEKGQHADLRLACLDDIANEVENLNTLQDPWKNYPVLKAILRDRVDWDSDFPIIRVAHELCEHKEPSPCKENRTAKMGPLDVQSGHIFDYLSSVWKEEGDPLIVKKEQLAESFWNTGVPNILNSTWERPLIKHVIMAYGVDISTEVGYSYRKREEKGNQKPSDADKEKPPNSFDSVPDIASALLEVSGGHILEERFDPPRGGLGHMLKKKPRKTNIGKGRYQYSGDGSIPYMSLIWVHTWLLHAVRALRHGDQGKDWKDSNPLEGIEISHRPNEGMEWVDGPPPPPMSFGEKKVEESSDTGTKHPHGTKYKPAMTRFHSAGVSRTTGIEYTTTVIEAVGVEHKETTRNYDILAAVFTDVLRKMHDDLEII